MDWVRFYARKGQTYRISVYVNSCLSGMECGNGEYCNPVIGVFESNGKTLIPEHGGSEKNDKGLGKDEVFEWDCRSDGLYYARIRQCSAREQDCEPFYGEKTDYNLELTQPELSDGLIIGKIIPASVKTVISTTSSEVSPTETLSNGYYWLPHLPGEFTLIAEPAGGEYETHTRDFFLPQLDRIIIDINLCLGDINGDTEVDLKDAIITLKVASGIKYGIIRSDNDKTQCIYVNEGKKIGLEETVYILEKTAGLRQHEDLRP